MSGRGIAAMVVGLALLPTTASAWDPGLVLQVAKDGVYTITPSELPPSKLVVHLHTERGEEHQLVWDGKQTSRLVRSVLLTAGEWEVDVWSEAINVPVWGRSEVGPGGPSAYPMPGPQWNRAGGTAGLTDTGTWNCTDPTGSSRRDGTGCELDAATGVTLELRWRDPKQSRPVFSADAIAAARDEETLKALLANRYVYVDIQPRPAPSLADASSRLVDGPTREAVGGARAFGETAVPAAVVEAFELLAELAFEMARTRSFEFLSSRMELLLCEDLVWERIGVEGRNALFPASTGEPQWLPAGLVAADPILPATCEVVRNVRMEDLATAGEPLYQALMGDLGGFGLRVANDWLLATTGSNLEQVRKVLLPIVEHTADIVVGLVTGRKAVAEDSARLLLAELAQADWMHLFPDDLPDSVEGAKLTALLDAAQQARAVLRSAERELESARATLRAAVVASQKAAKADKKAQEAAKKAAADAVTAAEDAVAQALAALLTSRASLVEQTGESQSQAAAACGLAVAFGVMGSCYEDGGCTPQQVVERIVHADQYFELAVCEAVVGDDLRRTWPEIGSFVSQGLEIVIQARDKPPEQTVRAAVDLAFRVTEKVLEATIRDAETLAQARRVIEHLAEIFDGILAQEAATVVARTASLFRLALEDAAGGKKLKGADKEAMAALEKGTALLTAVTTYATTFEDEEGAAEEKREARKETLRQLILSTTNRRHRDGEWVVSVGANVGMRAAGYRWVPRGRTDDLADVPANQAYLANFSMPMGIALQRLPNGEFERADLRALKRTGIGGHLQFSIIDLGNFITHGVSIGETDVAEGKPVGSAVRWDQFFTFDLQAGAIFGTPSAPFVLGVNVRYSPGVFGRQPTADVEGVSGGAFETGLFVGFYVPFFDFN